MDYSLGALLAQNNDQGHEQAIYYLSRTMIGAEHRYILVKKECLALVFVVQKMRHYLVGQTIHVISKVNPLSYVETIIVKRSIGEMGSIALAIRDAIPATESYQRTSSGRHFG